MLHARTAEWLALSSLLLASVTGVIVFTAGFNGPAYIASTPLILALASCAASAHTQHPDTNAWPAFATIQVGT